MTSSDDGRWASTVDDAGAMTMVDAPAPSSLPRPSMSSSESESRAALERALTQDDDPLLDLETATAGGPAAARRRGRRGRRSEPFDEEAWIGNFGVLPRGGRNPRVSPKAGGGKAQSSGRIGLVATGRVNQCEMLIRERVTAIQGTFRSKGACLGQLMARLRERNEMFASRARAPPPELSRKLLACVEEKEEVLSAGTKVGVEDEEAWLEFAAFVKYNAVTRNSRPAMTSGIGGSSGFVQCSMVMFDAISACNHSCDPNAEVSQVSDEGEVTLYSLRTIEPGEEITICYGKPSMRWLPARCRRRALRKDWCFECSCEKCVAEIASGLAVNKPMSRPWDILDPRWFFCTHDYATGFESHFDTEGNLLAMKTSPSVSTNTLASMIGEDVSSSALSASDILYRDFDGKIKLNGGRTDDHGTDDDDDTESGFSTSSSGSSASSVDLEEEEFDQSSSGSEDEDVMRWHERWRSKRLKTYSIKNVGLLTPLQLYRAMQRCQIRQDHWQFLVVREALIMQILNDASLQVNIAGKRPPAPSLWPQSTASGKFRAFKLLLNHCRSLVRMTPNAANFIELFATLENVYYWHAVDGWYYRQTDKHRRLRAAKLGTRAGADASPLPSADDFFNLPERSRWWFRLENLRNAAHPDVLAWNMSFGKSPNSPF